MVAKDHSYLLIPITSTVHFGRPICIGPQRRMSLTRLFQVINCQRRKFIRHFQRGMPHLLLYVQRTASHSSMRRRNITLSLMSRHSLTIYPRAFLQPLLHLSKSPSALLPEAHLMGRRIEQPIEKLYRRALRRRKPTEISLI
jgi:hypothetical protein